MPEWTPGPWFVDDVTVYALNDRKVNQFWATVQSIKAKTLNQGASTKECKAVAQLMAAAPDMYEALKAAERYMTEIGVSHEYPVMINARKALQKAEKGES